MMKRITQLLVIIALVTGVGFVSAPAVVHAVDITSDTCNALSNKPAVCADANSGRTSNPVVGPNGIVTKAVQLLVGIGGIIAIFVLLINGVRMITSMGNSDSFTSARNGIIYAAVGLVIVILSQAIIVFVIKKL